MSRLRIAAAAVAVAMLAGSQRASAESVSLQFEKSVNGGVNLSGVPGGAIVQPGPFYWQDSGLPPNTNFPPPTSTFCIEVSGPLPAIGSSAIFGVESLAADLGTAKANAITELYGRFFNTAWENSSFTGSATSIAFQLALWELAIDGKASAGNTNDLSNGSFTASTAIGPVQVQAQSMLNSLTGDTSSFNTRFPNQQLAALIAPDPNDPKPQDFQNQVTLIPKAAVPAPPGVVLASIGFLGLIGRGRWLRRKQG